MKKRHVFSLLKILSFILVPAVLLTTCVKTEDVIDPEDFEVWKKYGSSVIGSNYVLSMSEDNAGNIWVGTYGGGVSVFSNENWYNFSTASGHITNDTVNAVVQDGSGNYWIATGGGLNYYYYDSGYGDWIWAYFTYFDGVNVTALCVDASGEVVIGTFGYGLFYYDYNLQGFVQVFDDQCGFCNYVNKLYTDKSGTVWCGTYSGLKQLSPDISNYTLYTTDNGLITNDIYSIFQDSNGALWVGGFGESFVNKYTGGTFQLVSLYNGLPSIIYDIAEDQDGNLWFGGFEIGATKYDGLLMRTYFQKDGFPGNTITAIHKAGNGDLWFGTMQNGIGILNPYSNY
jgi:ligand-binding sensor domain-containing protein